MRIAIEYTQNRRKDIVANAIQVPAQWQKSDEDIWSFDTSDKSLRNIIFRTTPKDHLEHNSRLIIELVVYVRAAGKIVEMSCGWCELNIDELSKAMTHKLPVLGGSPQAEMEISDKDLRTNRSGLKFMQKVLVGGVQKSLEIEVKPYAKLPQETKAHMDMLPSTCLVHKSLLYFVSGFMNYKAERLLRESATGIFRKPSGDVVISSFPGIYDNPDIVEELTSIWTEDIQPLIDRQKMNIDFIVTKMKETISRLYPILHSEAFKGIDFAPTVSLVGNQVLLDKRKRVIESALRFSQIH